MVISKTTNLNHACLILIYFLPVKTPEVWLKDFLTFFHFLQIIKIVLEYRKAENNVKELIDNQIGSKKDILILSADEGNHWDQR